MSEGPARRLYNELLSAIDTGHTVKIQRGRRGIAPVVFIFVRDPDDLYNEGLVFRRTLDDAYFPEVLLADTLHKAVTSIRSRYGLSPVTRLTANDPEPPAGTVVRDAYGRTWECIEVDEFEDGGKTCWIRVDVRDDPESWVKVAGNYGPVTIEETP